jgi:amino acid transporter
MTIVLYIIAILWIVVGTFIVIYTEGTREFYKKLFLRDNVKWMAVLPFIFGVILVVGAFYCERLFWLAIILGILALAKGVYIFLAPSSQIKGLLDWIFNRATDGSIRLFGLIIFILGSAMLSYLM